MEITPNVILQMHKYLYKYSPKSYGGKFKDIENAIEEIENRILYQTGIPIFIEMITKRTIDEVKSILSRLKTKAIDKRTFEIPDMVEKNGKYNYFVPNELLQKQYIEDCIDVKNMQENL